MEKRIKDRYNNEILHQARQRYGIAADIHLLDGFESAQVGFLLGQQKRNTSHAEHKEDVHDHRSLR